MTEMKPICLERTRVLNCIFKDKTQISNLSLYQLFILFILLPEYTNKITVYFLRLKIRRNGFTGGKKINRRLEPPKLPAKMAFINTNK